MNAPAAMPLAIDAQILGEAADWLVLFQSGETGVAEREHFEHWRAQSMQHAAAWQRAEAILGSFQQVPAAIGRQTLSGLPAPGRRQAIKLLTVLLTATPAGWLAWRHTPWRQWTADLRTATGEQQTIALADGTRLVLNTDSAVDIVYTATERQLVLHQGEILVTTSQDPSPSYRPFLVQTVHGSMLALGTRFSVRMLQDATSLAVFEHAVEVRPQQTPMRQTLHAGQQLTFTANETGPVQSVDSAAALWEQGMLVARDMPLGELVAELARYRSGILRCHPAVAAMPVSGAFPLRDIPASLALLQKTLPVQIRSVTPYWISVSPR